MDSPFILVVEDDRDLADLLLFNLKQAGFSCQAIADGLAAWQWLQSNQPDLALLDIMLPGMDGLELCRRLCQRNTPVIMLTARDEEIDRVVGLELGADDYVTKPFSIRELLLRIKAVLRRREQQETPAAHLKVGRLYINSDNHYVSVNDEPLDLTVTEFNLLLFLARRPGRVLTRDFLLQQVWGYSNPGYARTVDTHIRRLRQKLEPADGCLETVRGLGYRFNAEQA